MAGRKRLPRKDRLASGNQLYVLNRAGHLHVVDENLEPISSAEADVAIKAGMEADARDPRFERKSELVVDEPVDGGGWEAGASHC